MKTFVFEVEEVRNEKWYVEAKNEDEAREKLFEYGEKDESFSHNSSLLNVTLVEVDDE